MSIQTAEKVPVFGQLNRALTMADSVRSRLATVLMAVDGPSVNSAESRPQSPLTVRQMAADLVDILNDVQRLAETISTAVGESPQGPPGLSFVGGLKRL